MALKWGIASCGLISQDFVTALKSLPKDHHQVVAVAARSQSSAEKFAKEHSILRAYEGYTTLAQDKDVGMIIICILSITTSCKKYIFRHCLYWSN